jgi:hypothetical protein
MLNIGFHCSDNSDIMAFIFEKEVIKRVISGESSQDRDVCQIPNDEHGFNLR